MNIVNMVLDLLSSKDTLGKAASMLGIGQEQAGTAMKATVPSLLAGLLGAANKPGGGATIANALSRQGSFDERDASRYFTGSSSEGTSALSSILGENGVNQIGSVLSRFTGLGEGTIGKLIGFISPVLLGMVGKYTRGLDAAGITNFFAGQKSNIESALPSGLSSMLSSAIPGFSSQFAETAKTTYHNSRTDQRFEEPVGAGRQGEYHSPWRWILPLVLAALFLYFVPKMFRRDYEHLPPVGQQAMIDKTPAGEASREIITEGSDLITRSSDSVGAIRDQSGAVAALPTVRGITEKWEDLQVRYSKLPVEAKKQVVNALRPLASDFRASTTSVLAIPGVSEKIKPALDEQFRQMDKVVPPSESTTW